MIPATNAQQESSFSFFKRNMRVFGTLNERNLFGLSLCQVNDLSEWLMEKESEELKELLNMAREMRTDVKLRAIEELEQKQCDLLAALDVSPKK